MTDFERIKAFVFYKFQQKNSREDGSSGLKTAYQLCEEVLSDLQQTILDDHNIIMIHIRIKSEILLDVETKLIKIIPIK